MAPTSSLPRAAHALRAFLLLSGCAAWAVILSATADAAAAPTVTGISPSGGPLAGNTSVTITGTSFTGATSVTFGGTGASGFTVNSATQITATTPAHAAGTVDVAVTTPGGASATSAADQFTYVTPPVAVADGGGSIYATGVNRQFGRGATGGVLKNDTLNGATITSYGASTGNEQATIGAATPTAQGGSVTLNADGSFTFTPKASFAGNDTFKYTLTNAGGSSTATATIYVDVLPTVTGMVPANSSTGVSIGTAITINFSETIETTATFMVADTTSSTSVSFTQAPADGNATSTFTLTPSAALVGGHVYTVTVLGNQTADLDGGQSMAANYVFSFTTLPLPVAVNDPDAQGHLYQVTENVTFDSALLATPSSIFDNDLLYGASVRYGPSGPLANTAVDGSTTVPSFMGGTVLLRVNGTFLYTPPAGFTGTDRFFYKLTNGSVNPAMGTPQAQALFNVSVPVPTVVSATPASGPTAGGTSVTITGTNFTGATAVTIGGNAATTFTVNSPTQITATTPAGTAGPASVVVTIPTGSNAANTLYTYVAPPTITGITPTSGSTAGGTGVTITGTNFTGVTAVTLGGNAATTFTVNSSTQITATTPAGTPGTASVLVTTSGGSTAANTLYTYVAPPTVTGISPTSGPTAGGTSVTITGTNFTGATAVTIGGNATTAFTVNSSTQITATTPAGTPGTASVVVTTLGGNNAANTLYTYVAPPTVTAISPTSGSTAGGTGMTITGTNFIGAKAVTIGGNAATTFTVNSSTQITATTPAGLAGTASVVVTTPGGSNAANTLYTYVAPPTITGISPTSGSTAGGTSVTITGTNFTGATAVTIGGNATTAFTVNGPTQITATTPVGTAGTASVLVTTPGGSNAANTLYTYVAPTFSSWAASNGLTGGNAQPGAVLQADGLTNLFKYALGLSPSINYPPNSPDLPAVNLPSAAGTNYLTLSFNGMASDVSYTVQATSDLTAAWTTIRTFPAGSTPPGSVVIQDTQSTSSTTKRFMRLLMLLP